MEITNPIELGKSIDAKTFFLDIKVLLNDNTVISLEMQVINEHNWPERSLSYLCRSFDSLNRGDSYLMVKPVVQISLLDFTLFPDYPEFYATYQLLNVKNFIKYSDKLCLHVLDLTRIDLATDEDRQYQIDYWAAFFKATTWEELKMLAEKNESIAEAVETVYQLSEEEKIRLQCEAREDYYRRQKDAQILRERQEKRMQESERKMQEQEQRMQEQMQLMQEQNRLIQERDQLLQEYKQQMQELVSSNHKLSEGNKKQAEQIALLSSELERLKAEQQRK